MKFKALSFRQPWAELVMRGEKTMDLRTWRVSYRGPLAVHAARQVEHLESGRRGLAADLLPRGAVVGVVELVDVIALDQEAYEQRRDEHLGVRRYREPLYGWMLDAPRRLRAPWPASGRQRFFEIEIPDKLLAEPGEHAVQKEIPAEARPFELYVVREAGEAPASGGYGLALYQRQVNNGQRRLPLYMPGPGEGMVRVAELRGRRLRLVAGEVLAALREAGHTPTELTRSRREPFSLPEETGVRLGLLFLGVSPLSRPDRMDAISEGLRAMPAEEAYYWYSKCAYGPLAPRARRALRILLAEDE